MKKRTCSKNCWCDCHDKTEKRTDKERLDWLENTAHGVYPLPDWSWTCVQNARLTIREAIDAAMTADRARRKGESK